jgi:8-oxo-dGTP diphosphatase
VTKASRIKAAGAIVYRKREDALEVLLVHRPRYNDWSFPKGKLDPGESAEVAACREVHEETGIACVLNQSLGRVEYDTEGVDDLLTRTRKNVRYYAASRLKKDSPVLKSRKPVKLASKKEIDQVGWFEARDALPKLTYRDDQKLLKTFLSEYEINEWVEPRVVVEIQRVKNPPKNTSSAGEGGNQLEADRKQHKKALRKTCDFLSSLGIETLVTFTKKSSAYETFSRYSSLTGFPILYFHSPSDPEYLKLFNAPLIRMAQIMK